MTTPYNLHPEWKELTADSWEGKKSVWLIRPPFKTVTPMAITAFANAVCDMYTHWQIADAPKVIETDEEWRRRAVREAMRRLPQ